ncbi:hypothetical protein SLE2022_211250 [Rubroshorea leprosula]
MPKLNTDGSFPRNSGLASAGGLVQDAQGSRLHGFVANIGTRFIAELWGLREAFRLRRVLGIEKLIGELDSLVAIQLVKENSEPNGTIAALVLDTRGP